LYENEKIAYGKDKAKFYLLENPVVASEISNRVYGTIKVQNNDMSVEESANELADQSNNIQNLQSVNLLSQEYEVELAEVYVKSNTLKKVIENTIGTEVLISIDISEKFNPVLNSPEVYAAEVIGLLNEIDYMIAAVENVSKNSKYLGIEVDEKLLRERLNLLMSSRFSIVFTKKPVLKHLSLPMLNFRSKGSKPTRARTVNISNNSKRSAMIPLGVGLLLVGLFVVIYSVSQTFFSMSVIDDEQNLLSLKYEQNQDTSLEELRSINSLETNFSLDDTGEFQESVLSVVSKTMTNQNAKEEFLPDVVGRLIIFPSKVDHYVVYASSAENLEFGPGYYVSTALPGTGGNFAIAGHRTTYGAPFKNLDKLKAGDNIYFQTNTNQYTYTVSEVKIVDPSETYLLSSFGDDRITLTTCHPKFSARQRLVVIGMLTKVEVFG
jgi:LPXTG-site transpeptidase (sortase) family protein